MFIYFVRIPCVELEILSNYRYLAELNQSTYSKIKKLRSWHGHLKNDYHGDSLLNFGRFYHWTNYILYCKEEKEKRQKI